MYSQAAAMRRAASVLRVARCASAVLSAPAPLSSSLVRVSPLRASVSRSLHHSPHPSLHQSLLPLHSRSPVLLATRGVQRGPLTHRQQPTLTTPQRVLPRTAGSAFSPPPPPPPPPSSNADPAASSASPDDWSFAQRLSLFLLQAFCLYNVVTGVIDIMDLKEWPSDLASTREKHRDSKAYLRGGALEPPLPPATPITHEQRAALAAELFPSLKSRNRLDLMDSMDVGPREDRLRLLSLPDCSVRDLLDLLRHPLPAGDSPSGHSEPAKLMDSVRLVKPRSNTLVNDVLSTLTSATAHWQNEAARVALARQMLELQVRADCLEVQAVLRDPFWGTDGSAWWAGERLASLILPDLMLLDRRDDVIVARECLLFAMKRAEGSQRSLSQRCQQRMCLGRAFEYTKDWSASASQYRTAMELDKSPRPAQEALSRLAFVTAQNPRAGKGVALSYAVASIKLLSGAADAQSTVDQALALPPNESLSAAARSRLHSAAASVLDRPPIKPQPSGEWSAREGQKLAAHWIMLARLLEEDTGAPQLIQRATTEAHSQAAVGRPSN